MRSVRFVAKASADVDSVLHWFINERNAPEAAIKWRNSLRSAVQKLEVSAHSFGFAPENPHVKYELHQLVFKAGRSRSYRLVYTIKDDEVLVLRVRGPGQAPVDRRDLGEPFG